MDPFRQNASIIFINKKAFQTGRGENDFTSVIYNRASTAHDELGCGETNHAAQGQTVTQSNQHYG
jgi:hypothetical protein